MAANLYRGTALLDQAKAIAKAGAERAMANKRAADALELINDDLATGLVPFPRFACERNSLASLRELQKAVSDTLALAELGPLDLGTREIAGELFTRLAAEFAHGG